MLVLEANVGGPHARLRPQSSTHVRKVHVHKHLYKGMLLEESNVSKASNSSVERRGYASSGRGGKAGVDVQNVLTLERGEEVVDHAHKGGAIFGIVHRLGAKLDSRRVVRHVTVLGRRDEEDVTEMTKLVIAAKLKEVAAVRLHPILERKLSEAMGVPPASQAPHAELDKQIK